MTDKPTLDLDPNSKHSPDRTANLAPMDLDALLRSGFTVALSYTHGQDGYEDEAGGVTEPVAEGYNAVLFDETGRQVGEGEGATQADALAAIRIPDASEYSGEPPFDVDARPLSDPGEFPAV